MVVFLPFMMLPTTSYCLVYCYEKKEKTNESKEDHFCYKMELYKVVFPGQE